MHTDSLNYLIAPTASELASQVTINVIAIGFDDGVQLQKYSQSEIWVEYSLSPPRQYNSSITYALTGNYTLDKEYINILSNLNTKYNFLLSDFQVVLLYTNGEGDINPEYDCGGFKNIIINFCLPHTDTVSGFQKLKNSLKIVNYYDSFTYPNTVTTFLQFASDIYTNCEFDYSTDCIESIFSKYNANSSIFETGIEGAIFTQDVIPLYFINENLYLWPDYLEVIYCLSLSNPSSACPVCNNGCTYQDLYSSSCSQACNISQCGYNNLNCLIVNNCYTFMTSNNSNSQCTNNNDTCAPGCYFSEMASGLCPMSCEGTCSSHCSSKYCSPNCQWIDLIYGNCSSDCTPSCISSCNNPQYCTPQCQEISQNDCPLSCNINCCQGGNSSGSSNSKTMIIIIVVVIFGLIS